MDVLSSAEMLLRVECAYRVVCKNWVDSPRSRPSVAVPIRGRSTLEGGWSPNAAVAAAKADGDDLK